MKKFVPGFVINIHRFYAALCHSCRAMKTGRSGLFVGLFGLLLVVSAPVQAGSQVVLVSIDGLRPDAITSSTAPFLTQFIREGVYFPRAQATLPSTTLPNHLSMVTGLSGERHGLRVNKESTQGHTALPTIFSVIKQAGYSSSMYYGKRKLGYLAAPGDVALVLGPGNESLGYSGTSASALARQFARNWPNRSDALTFMHFREPDKAGHRYAWMSPEYLQAVRESDRALSDVVEAVRRSDRKATTTIIVTADHGGKGKKHWGEDSLEHRTIPWLAVGPGIARGAVIARPIRIEDTAPTVLRLLGLAFTQPVEGVLIKELFPGKP
ncbi:MAG: alkaline phosphatase [Gammaproteobacteria bacterium]|nr:MAG: alkaline phosphatase [Gammaproteobacteria bacterium]